MAMLSKTRVYSPASDDCQHQTAACPECGGLECLCRPRFFAGQLLTDKDLNRLDHYIVEKNKLHNRNLHGWGVVNGLDVKCSPCDGTVVVSAGYALSPCGEDIVVCRDDKVDVCAMIRACQDKRRDQICEPLRPYLNWQDCKDLEEEWILAICFDEKPSRGVASLKASGAASCCSRCNCSGAFACGCGCHDPSSANKKVMASSRQRAPAQCEPTVTCETYTYKVFRAPVRALKAEQGSSYTIPVATGDHPMTSKALSPSDLGPILLRYLPTTAMGARLMECLGDLIQLALHLSTGSVVAKDSKAEVEPIDWMHMRNRLCYLRDQLAELVRDHPAYDCGILQELAGVACPNPKDKNFQVAVRTGFVALGRIMQKLLRACVCSALLPPAPGPIENNCVPLATLTVRRSDCTIVKVCNVGVRRYVLTVPNVQYWLSLLPLEQCMHEVLAALCCGTLLPRDGYVRGVGAVLAVLMRQWKTMGLVARPKPAAAAAPPAEEAGKAKTETAEAFAAKIEFGDLRSVFDVEEILRPAFEGILPPELPEMVREVAARARAGIAADEQQKEIAGLRTQLDELRKLVQDQQAVLEELKKK